MKKITLREDVRRQLNRRCAKCGGRIPFGVRGYKYCNKCKPKKHRRR